MIYKRGKQGFYWYKFMFRGELIRESTKQGNDKVARNMQAKHRTRLADEQKAREQAMKRFKCSKVLLCDECEKWFDQEDSQQQDGHTFCGGPCLAAWTKRHTKIPTLAQFLKDDFLPFVKVHFATKAKSAAYYGYGAVLLLETSIGDLRLSQITSQHAAGYIAKQEQRSPSTTNCGLRTLRRALNKAEEWGKIDRAPKIELAKGERQRERVVNLSDFRAYNEMCKQPWRDVATVLYGTAMRPGEVYALRWEYVLLNGAGGLIQISQGKTKNAKRYLPMTPEVYQTIKARHGEQGCPKTGWVFPAGSISGHLEESSAKHSHNQAVRILESASAAYRKWVDQGSKGDWLAVVTAATKLGRDYLERHSAAIQGGWNGFAPYSLRHSALTMLASVGCDAFTLARIAGHASIRTTERYIHPQADAIERAFESLAGGHKIGHTPELPETSGLSDESATDCQIDG